MRNTIHKETQSIGERLRARREECGMTVKDMAHELQTSQRFILALEENHFGVFSAKVYARGFLEKILVLFARKGEYFSYDLPRFLKEFDAEWEVFMQKKRRTGTGGIAVSSRDVPFVTPKKIAVLISLVFLLLFVFFVGGKVIGFLRSPHLRIDAPQEGIIVNTPMVGVRGKAEQESQLTVNGREIKVDELGNFDEEIELPAGRTLLEFVVRDRFGKTAHAMRYVVVK